MEFTAEQQAHIDTLVGGARTKARDKAKADLEIERAKAVFESEQAALAAGEEWQKLSATHEARVKELEPFEAKAKQYDALVKTMLKEKVKGLGDSAKKALAALPESLTEIEKLNWLTANVELFAEKQFGVGTPNRQKLQKTDNKKASPFETSVRL